jgi:hypothetical protein
MAATSRRPMWITLSRTEETAFSSGTRATGRASVTDTTASRPGTRITPLSTNIDCGSGAYLWGGVRGLGLPRGRVGISAGYRTEDRRPLSRKNPRNCRGWVPMNLLQNDSDCLTDSYHKSGNIDLSRFFIRRCIEAIF